MDSLDVLKWGWMRYLSTISVSATVDGGWHGPSLENPALEHYQCTDVCVGSRKSHLQTLISDKVCALFKIYLR